MINWTELNKNKNKLMDANNFWILKVKRTTSENLAANRIKELSLSSVLEIGANDKHFKDKLPDHINYKSMDIDRKNKHDYYNIKNITEKFDAVVMFACIEHIEKEEFIKKYLKQIKKILRPGGYIFISTNNIFHNIGIRTDLTHVQQYSPRDLNSILISNGFQSGECYRITSLNIFFRGIYSMISRYVLRPYTIDFCPEIILINKTTKYLNKTN